MSLIQPSQGSGVLCIALFSVLHIAIIKTPWPQCHNSIRTEDWSPGGCVSSEGYGVGRAACMVGHTWVGGDLTLGLVMWLDSGESPGAMGSGGLRSCAISCGCGSRAILHAGSLVCIYLYNISNHHFSDGASVDTNS